MKCKLFGAASAALLLCACANYPSLATFPAAPTGNELDDVLAEARTLQAEYSFGYKNSAKWQDWSQLPLIGAAAAAAAFLLDNKSHAAKIAGFIGIGAATYSAARGQLTAAGLPDAYIAGHGALTCILAEGSYFSGDGAVKRYSRFADLRTQVVRDIQLTTDWRDKNPKTTKEQAENLTTARKLADQAIDTAKAANAAALTEEDLYSSPAPTFRNAVSNVSVRVASKGRVRPPVDYAALRDRMASAGSSGGETIPASNTKAEAPLFESNLRREDATSVIDGLMAATRSLALSTAQLTAGTPKYSESLKRTAECPELIK